jgi:hypothetical protein
MQELSCKKSYGSKKATLQRAKELIRKVFSSVWCKGKGEEHCADNTDGNGSLAMTDIKENRTAGNKERAPMEARMRRSAPATRRRRSTNRS